MRNWTVETADESAGDAQGRVMFLPENYNVSELKRQHGERVSHVVAGKLLERRLTAKEVTIFDADEYAATPRMDIRVNGFEFDTSGDLRDATQAWRQVLYGSAEDPTQEMYDLSTEKWQNDVCNIYTEQELDLWVRAAQHMTKFLESGKRLPCKSEKARTFSHKPRETMKFTSFRQNCHLTSPTTDIYDLKCDDAVNIGDLAKTTLKANAQVEFGHFVVTQNRQARPALGMTGVELAMASEKARKRVINSILTQSVQVGNDFVKVVNPDEAKDAVAIIEAAARAAHNLVE